MIPEDFMTRIAQLLEVSKDKSLATDQYKVFTIKTKHKVRHICEPKNDLKAFHRQCADVFNSLPTADSCYSKPGKSTVHNALPHIGANIIYKTDIANFYPTVSHNHVMQGYYSMIRDNTADQINNISMTSMVSKVVSLCYTEYAVGLPTGAPSSPALSNVAMHNVDGEIDTLCKKAGYTYTRYFDDLTFSKDTNTPDHSFAKRIADILRNYGFLIRDDKSKWVLPNTHEAFEVTGINIGNGKATVPRSIKRLVRAMLDKLAREYINDEELSVLTGYIAYIDMVDKDCLSKLDTYYQERCIYHVNKRTR